MSMTPEIQRRLRELVQAEEEKRAAYERSHPTNKRAVNGAAVGLMGGFVLGLVLGDLGMNAYATGAIVALFSTMAVYLPVVGWPK